MGLQHDAAHTGSRRSARELEVVRLARHDVGCAVDVQVVASLDLGAGFVADRHLYLPHNSLTRRESLIVSRTRWLCLRMAASAACGDRAGRADRIAGCSAK